MFLPYRATNFSASLGSALQGKRTLACSWSDLVWAATTVGRPSWAAVFKYGWYSKLEFIYRLTMLRANLKATSIGPSRISKTMAFVALDPSEKTAISYFVGLTTAKILAFRLFGAAWPQHLDNFAGSLTPPLLRSERPDLLARDTSGRWIVFEAKGRSNSLNSQDMGKAKKQVRRVSKINGKAPFLRVAIGSYFAGDILRARLEDPREGNDLSELRMSEESFFQSYYSRIANLALEAGQEVERFTFTNQFSFSVVQIPEIDVSIGLGERILSAYRREATVRPVALEVAASLLPEAHGREVEILEWFRNEARRNVSSVTVGTDGVLVALGQSWSEEQMAQEPEDRKPLA